VGAQDIITKRGKTPRERARARKRERTRKRQFFCSEYVHVAGSTMRPLVGFASLALGSFDPEHAAIEGPASPRVRSRLRARSGWEDG
jgi:hypothetical protein